MVYLNIFLYANTVHDDNDICFMKKNGMFCCNILYKNALIFFTYMNIVFIGYLYFSC